jgi:hypothetical protein
MFCKNKKIKNQNTNKRSDKKINQIKWTVKKCFVKKNIKNRNINKHFNKKNKIK